MESDQSRNHNQHIMNKKRTYIKMTDKIRYEFTFRTLVLGESGIVVARALGINYFTAQNMVTLFKKTGRFGKEPTNQETPHEDTEYKKKSKLLPRLDIYYENGELFVKFPHKMTLYQQECLWGMHDRIEQGSPLTLKENIN